MVPQEGMARAGGGGCQPARGGVSGAAPTREVELRGWDTGSVWASGKLASGSVRPMGWPRAWHPPRGSLGSGAMETQQENTSIYPWGGRGLLGASLWELLDPDAGGILL